MPTDDGERWRVFVAVALPQAIQDQLQEPLKDLQALSSWIRANPVDRIHLTLHFLGNVDSPKTGDLIDAIRPVVAAHRRFTLTVGRVDAFRDIERPKVLWAGVKGSGLPDLMRLQGELGSALVRIGFEVEPRFTPHLTLGRVRTALHREGSQAVHAWYYRWHLTTFGEFVVDAVHLMRSQLGAGPPRYTTLASFALQ